jgi:hypothetical protein
MNTFNRVTMWLVLLGLIALTVLSIYGAFVGAERAKVLFNSVPLQMFWFIITIGLVGALILFPSLVKRPSLLLIHFGCIGILLGSISSSETGHRMYQQLFGKYKMRSGQMLIYEGQKTNKVITFDYQGMFELPFELGLDDFRVEYYKPGGDSVMAMPKDFISDISVVENGKIVKSESIEVNKPLYYGGYLFYQTSYDYKAGKYTVLTVVSDNGLFLVFGGYVFLILGLIGRCWLTPINRRLKNK